VYRWANGNVYEGEKMMMMMMLSMVMIVKVILTMMVVMMMMIMMMVISTCIIAIGQLKNDKKEGHGVFRYADGEMYEGKKRIMSVLLWMMMRVMIEMMMDDDDGDYDDDDDDGDKDDDGPWTVYASVAVVPLRSSSLSSRLAATTHINNLITGEFKDDNMHGHGYYRWQGGNEYEGTYCSTVL